MHRQFLLDEIPKGGVGCEIGVWKGDFSVRLLRATKPRRFVAIDPWRFAPEHPDRLYGGVIAADQAQMDGIFMSVCQRLSAFPGVQILRGPSVEMMERLPDKSLDWIYIDGDHSTDAALADLRLAWRKVRPDGLIMADDCDWQPHNNFPVLQAVKQFVSETGVQGARILNGQFVCIRSRTP